MIIDALSIPVNLLLGTRKHVSRVFLGENVLDRLTAIKCPWLTAMTLVAATLFQLWGPKKR